MTRQLLAITAAVALLLAGVAPAAATHGALDVTVDQPEAGSPATVTVEHNGTAEANASVNVTEVDGNYSGTGDYVTDANGTVELPAPSENVTIEVAAESANGTGTATADLLVASTNETAGNATFGDMVSSFVHSLLADDNRTGGIGQEVASFVLDNNPGNAPDHAGPPENAGPPDDAGPPAADDGNTTAASSGGGNGGGPPPWAGGGNGNGPDNDRGPPE